MSHTVHIGNIPYSATEEELSAVFREVGPIVSLRLSLSKTTSKSQGMGFCEYADAATALSAVCNLNGREFQGRSLRVDAAEHVPAAPTARKRTLAELHQEEGKITMQIAALNKTLEALGKEAKQTPEMIHRQILELLDLPIGIQRLLEERLTDHDLRQLVSVLPSWHRCARLDYTALEAREARRPASPPLLDDDEEEEELDPPGRRVRRKTDAQQ